MAPHQQSILKNHPNASRPVKPFFWASQGLTKWEPRTSKQAKPARNLQHRNIESRFGDWNGVMECPTNFGRQEKLALNSFEMGAGCPCRRRCSVVPPRFTWLQLHEIFWR